MRLGLDYEQVGRGKRKSLESWFHKGEEKRRLKAFYNFPFRTSISSATEFLSVFIGLYNLEIRLGLS